MNSSSARSLFTTSPWSGTHECCFQQTIVPKMMKNRFGKSKHKKFQDDWEKAKEPVVEGITFYVKYLGMSMVDKANDENCTAEAVKKIVNQVKYGAKPNKVSLKVTPQGIVQTDVETEQSTLEVSIYRISYCTADKTNEKVFGFISQNPYNDALELHAYLCTKRKVAEAIALTVAHSFNIAYERWEEKQDTNNITNRELASGEMLELQEQVSSLNVSSPLCIPGEESSSENGVSHVESSLGASPPLPSSNVVIEPPPRNPRVPSSSRICSSAPSSLPPPPPPPRLNHSRAGQLRRDNSTGTVVTQAETHVTPSSTLHDWTSRESNQASDSVP
ncbi:low density lipoprotein receptor adapter protein 1-A-like isoform X2 [Anneissia japonica]|uniref:low density lipoprotein receptor adapter protein 1-A-like isoform X2 n=1 Tax=Anneissia japonica TaxID=1529436 RepID=UPI001425AF2F|nr:low density lipoprotein receptor adapter protein 1-A-like isoform X2 [Anneissia japonica]